MKTECPKCGKKYEIPDRHRGRKFRCLKCKKKIRTSEPPSTVSTDVRLPHSTDANLSLQQQPSQKLSQFKKETGPADVGVFKGLKILSIVLFVGGIFAGLLMLVESRYGFLRNVQLDLEGIRVDSDADGSATNLPEPGLSSPSGTDSDSAVPTTGDSIAGPGDSGSNSSEDTEKVSLDSGDADSLPQMLPPDETYGQKPGLGEIEDFDPTWFTNNPNYSLRSLTKPDVNGSRMEKVVRSYGSPTFIQQYIRLQNSADFSVRFYSSLGLGNFGVNIDESLLVMLEAIATDRTRVGTTKLRLDLANRLLAVHHERVPAALHVMARRHSAEIKGFAIEYLGNLGVDAQPVVTEIAASILDPRPYVPQDPDLDVDTVGDVSLYALKRLQANAVGAVPQLLNQIKAMRESDLRTELNELVIDILTRSNDRDYRTEMTDWAKGIGMAYVPSSMRYLVHYKMPGLLKSGYYARIEKAPAFMDAIQLLEDQCGLRLKDLDFVTVAYENEAETIWQKRPFVMIVRTLESIDGSRFDSFPAAKYEGEVFLEVSPEVGLYRAGENRLILATRDDLKSIVAMKKDQSPRLVLPSDTDSAVYFEATQHFSVSCKFADGDCQMVSEFEYFLPAVADANLGLLKSGKFELPIEFPGPAKRVFQTTDQSSSIHQESRLKVVNRIPLDQVPLTLVKLDWLRPADSTSLEAWQDLVTVSSTHRGILSNASNRVQPELGVVNDLKRRDVCELIPQFFINMDVGPAKNFQYSGEEKTNLYNLLKLVTGWVEGPMLVQVKDYMNAAHFEQGRQIQVYANIPSSESLALIAENMQQVESVDLPDETWEQLARILKHLFAVGDEEVLENCLLVCQKSPQFVIEFNLPIKAIVEDPSASPELKQLASDVLSIIRQIRVVEQDYSSLEEYARDSGIANYALEGHRKLRGDPPKISELAPFRDEARVFDIKLPDGLHPDIWEIQLEGPVDRELEEYSEVTGLKYTVLNGDVIVVQRRNHQPAEMVKSDWNTTSGYLCDNLVSDQAGGSGAEFDRQRYYFSQGLPKAQRLIVSRGVQYEVRWMGRNHRDHPSYVDQIMSSFGIRE